MKSIVFQPYIINMNVNVLSNHKYPTHIKWHSRCFLVAIITLHFVGREQREGHQDLACLQEVCLMLVIVLRGIISKCNELGNLIKAIGFVPNSKAHALSKLILKAS